MMKETRSITLDGTYVSDNTDAYVIAEVGHNHQGNIETCMRIFDIAAHSGANAVKLQKRDNRSLYTKKFFDSPYNSENSYGPTYGLHREALEFNREQFLHLKEYAANLGLSFFATAFDLKSADLLAEIGIPCYKVASADIIHTPLLTHIAKIGKPMILSTGAASQEDIDRAINAILPYNEQLSLLQCTATYPASVESLNLNVISTLRKHYPNTVIGLSDHFHTYQMALVAYTLGARIFEKHLTFNRAAKGTDHSFSLEEGGLKRLVRDLKRTRLALGTDEKKASEEELKSVQKMRKSIVAACNLPIGHIITKHDLAYKSPGGGLLPYQNEQLIGKQLIKSLAEDALITLDDII